MHVLSTLGPSVLGAIQWDPEIRNILAFLVGLLVLCGSVYLLLMTNMGARLGLLVAGAVLLGWMTIMGVTWWVYGIGMKGEAAHWRATEINTADLSQASLEQARTLPPRSELPNADQVLARRPDLDKLFNPPPEGQNAEEAEAEGPPPKKQATLGDVIELDPSLRAELDLEKSDLGGWDVLAASDPQRGDATATADAALGAEKVFSTTSDYKVVDVFSFGGKAPAPLDASVFERAKHRLLSVWHWRHPTHYGLVQVQQVIPQEEVPGEAPPPPRADPSAPLVSVMMIRDLGDLRFPAAVITIVSGSLFALTCWRLHVRERLVARHRALAPT